MQTMPEHTAPTKPSGTSQSAWDKMTPDERATWLRTYENIGKPSSHPIIALPWS